MASVVVPLDQPSNYKDSQARLDRQKQNDILQKSTTLYVSSHSILHIPCTFLTLSSQIGNLSFFTTEEQIHDMFSKCANPEDGGGVKRIIMGLDRHTRYATLYYLHEACSP
jgi:nuclear cap-binding protein subunit 2